MIGLFERAKSYICNKYASMEKKEKCDSGKKFKILRRYQDIPSRIVTYIRIEP